MIGRVAAIILCVALAPAAADAAPALVPIALHDGINRVENIAGDGSPGAIILTWRDNGNAWGYHLYSVIAGRSVIPAPMAVAHGDQFRDAPHTGEDTITAVRFARGVVADKPTLIAVVAMRAVQGAVPDPAPTAVLRYALVRNKDGVGGPYDFVKIADDRATRLYCDADTALRDAFGFAPDRGNDAPRSPGGCFPDAKVTR